jgi:hypothetical protein
MEHGTGIQHGFDMAEARKSRSWFWMPQRFDGLDSNAKFKDRYEMTASPRREIL